MVASAERRTKHKKRHGQHQRQSKGFLKVYSPYLPLFMSLLISLVFIFSTTVKEPGNVQSLSTGINTNSLHDATNRQRARHNKKALAINSALGQAAQAKANDMVSQNYWSHETPNGNTPWFFLDETGYTYTKASENLAYGFTSSGDVVTGWMNSDSHRTALLDNEFSDVGFGLASSSNYNNDGPQTVVVAFYGSTEPAVSSLAKNYGITRVKSTSTVNEVPITNGGTYTVNRAQLATAGLAPAITIVIMVVAITGLAVLSGRHLIAFKKRLLDGERYLVKRPLIDITVVMILLTCIVITRAAGAVL